MGEFGNGFFWGIVAGIGGLCLVAHLATASATDVCEKQNWEGAGCQCRLTLGYDKKGK